MLEIENIVEELYGVNNLLNEKETNKRNLLKYKKENELNPEEKTKLNKEVKVLDGEIKEFKKLYRKLTVHILDIKPTEKAYEIAREIDRLRVRRREEDDSDVKRILTSQIEELNIDLYKEAEKVSLIELKQYEEIHKVKEDNNQEDNKENEYSESENSKKSEEEQKENNEEQRENNEKQEKNEENQNKKEKSNMENPKFDEINKMIEEKEQEIAILYQEGYTDSSPEVNDLKSAIDLLNKNLIENFADEIKKPKLTKEQIELNKSIEEKEREIAVLYQEGYTDSSQEIKSLKNELNKLYMKQKPIQQEKEEKVEKINIEKKGGYTRSQLILKDKINEKEQEKSVLYQEGYTDESAEVKDINSEIEELYKKMDEIGKDSNEIKLTEEEWKVQFEIEKYEQEIAELYQQGFVDSSKEIQDIKKKISELSNKSVETVENEKEASKNSVLEVKNENSKSDEEINDDIDVVGKEDANESVDVSDITSLIEMRESKLSKFKNSLFNYISNLWDKIKNSKIAHMVGKVFKGIKEGLIVERGSSEVDDEIGFKGNDFRDTKTIERWKSGELKRRTKVTTEKVDLWLNPDGTSEIVKEENDNPWRDDEAANKIDTAEKVANLSNENGNLNQEKEDEVEIEDEIEK